MSIDGQLKLAAQQLNDDVAHQPVPATPTRQRSGRVPLLVATAVAAVAAVVFVATLTSGDETEVATEPRATASAGVALGSSQLWPPTARHATPAEVANAFAREVLGWQPAGASVFEDGDATGPVWVRLVQPGVVELVDVLTVPDTDGNRVIIELGPPWALGMSVESIAPGEEGSRIGLIRVAGATEAQLNLLLDSGGTEPITATNLDIQAGRIDVATIADPATIRSVLVLYRDDRGQVIAATGATFDDDASEDEPPGTVQLGPDGVNYLGAGTEIVQTGSLTLVIQDSNAGTCLQVRTNTGGMSGGCGADFSTPMSVQVGSIGETAFASGWAPAATARLTLTFGDGSTQDIERLTQVDAYGELVFFLVPIPRPETGTDLPLPSVAYNSSGEELARLDH